jgi:hypothetical protein
MREKGARINVMLSLPQHLGQRSSGWRGATKMIRICGVICCRIFM